MFAYGDWPTYQNNKDSFDTLSEPAEHKLRILTILDMASRTQILKFEDIAETLTISDERKVEALVLDCFYLKLVKGKIDSKNKQLYVEWTQGRDVRKEEIDGMLDQLEDWVDQIEETEKQMTDKVDDLHANVKGSQEEKAEFLARLKSSGKGGSKK